nr:spore photoproduct lyase [Clostridium paraputrificum]
MFIPNKAVIEEKALEYEKGREILEKFKKFNISTTIVKSNRYPSTRNTTPAEKFMDSKRTLIVGVRKKIPFQSCKPSAHYQLPLISGCSGMCEYCYLNTQLGKRPYTKINVNIEEILNQAMEYVEERKPDITIFEGAATSDPISVEYYSGALAKAIEVFGENELTRFRFVSKFSDVDSLLKLKNNGHTTIRFSINTQKIIREFEHGTDNIDRRLEAAKKVKEAGYNLGFIIAPVFIYPNWKEEYLDLLDKIKKDITTDDLMFEVISHRFTGRAKERILEVYPNSKLPMNEEERKYKYGQFGYGKFVYPKEELNEMKEFFKSSLEERFGGSSINYII